MKKQNIINIIVCIVLALLILLWAGLEYFLIFLGLGTFLFFDLGNNKVANKKSHSDGT